MIKLGIGQGFRYHGATWSIVLDSSISECGCHSLPKLCKSFAISLERQVARIEAFGLSTDVPPFLARWKLESHSRVDGTQAHRYNRALLRCERRYDRDGGRASLVFNGAKRGGVRDDLPTN